MDKKYLAEVVRTTEAQGLSLTEYTRKCAKQVLADLKHDTKTYGELKEGLAYLKRSTGWESPTQCRELCHQILTEVDYLLTKEMNNLPVIQEQKPEVKQVRGQVIELADWKDDIEALEKRVDALEQAQARPKAGVIRIPALSVTAEQIKEIANGLHALNIRDGKVYLDGFRVRGVSSYELKRDHSQVPTLKLEIGIQNKNLEAFLGSQETNI